MNPKTFWKMIKSISRALVFQHSPVRMLNSLLMLIKLNCRISSSSVTSTIYTHHYSAMIHPLPLLTPLSVLTIYLLCTEYQVYNLIASLDYNSATSADNISASMLKDTVSSITPSLTKIFNLSIKTGSFPQSWKCARVVPIPKGGGPFKPNKL